MSRFLRALFLSAAATTVAVVVSEVVRSSKQRHAGGRDYATVGKKSDPEDDLSDEMRNALVSELGQHV